MTKYVTYNKHFNFGKYIHNILHCGKFREIVSFKSRLLGYSRLLAVFDIEDGHGVHNCLIYDFFI